MDELKKILGDILQVGNRLDSVRRDDALLGGIPEFDSMAVVSVLTWIEDDYGIVIDDDDDEAGRLRRPWALVLPLCLAAGFGILDEYYQFFTPGRYASLTDVLFDVIGAGFGVVFFWWLRRSISAS